MTCALLYVYAVLHSAKMFRRSTSINNYLRLGASFGCVGRYHTTRVPSSMKACQIMYSLKYWPTLIVLCWVFVNVTLVNFDNGNIKVKNVSLLDWSTTRSRTDTSIANILVISNINWAHQLTVNGRPKLVVFVCQWRSQSRREDVLVLTRDWSKLQSPSEWTSSSSPFPQRLDLAVYTEVLPGRNLVHEPQWNDWRNSQPLCHSNTVKTNRTGLFHYKSAWWRWQYMSCFTNSEHALCSSLKTEMGILIHSKVVNHVKTLLPLHET